MTWRTGSQSPGERKTLNENYDRHEYFYFSGFISKWTSGGSTNVRDVKDRPILRAALNEGTDLFLTGDKDFLESAVEDPRIVSVSEFFEKY
jgi:predicted nucleic acid-binding protein